MNDYIADEYTFDALCLTNRGPRINTLAYLVGLVDSEDHVAGNPDTARYRILYRLAEIEEKMPSAKDLLNLQAQLLPPNYFPQTPVMFVQRWSPIYAMLEKGFKPETLKWLGEAPHAVATGIWNPMSFEGAKRVDDCRSDVDLFWSIMAMVISRAKERNCLVNIVAEVGWKYERMIGSLPSWNAKQVARSGRILWRRTWQG